MKKVILLFTCLVSIILSFLAGFFIKKFIDDKKFELIYEQQVNLQKINKNLIKENEFLNELNNKILNQDNLIDKKEDECLSKSISTADSLSCIYNAEKTWDMEITRYLKLLKNVMSYSEYKLIEKKHNLWKEQNKNNNEIIDKFIFNHDGTMYQQIGLDKKVELKKQRTEFLKETYNIYTDNITDN